MQELLVQAGLSEAQAAAYLYLLEHGASAPPTVALGCHMTRTNAYKVLDSLVELGLANKKEAHKKFLYEPAEPTALASLVGEQRNRVIALEHNVKTAMSELRAKYRHSTGTTTVTQGKGSDAIVATYTAQAEKMAPIYFIKSRADVPFLGFETMHKIRYLGADRGSERYGITPNVTENPIDPRADIRTNLTRTLIAAEAYTAPVEWTVSGDELRIIKFDGDGEYICIQDSEIAESFRQVWQLARDSKRAQQPKARG